MANLNSATPAKTIVPQWGYWIATLLMGAFLIGGVLIITGIIWEAHAWSEGIPETSKAMSANQISDEMVGAFNRWEILGGNEHFDSITGKFVKPIKASTGFTRYGGMDGAGTEWIALQLDPVFAESLRSQLAQTPAIIKGATPLYRSPDQDWWPTQWPNDVHCFHDARNFEQLILPDTGNDAWYVREWLSGSDHYNPPPISKATAVPINKRISP